MKTCPACDFQLTYRTVVCPKCSHELDWDAMKSGDGGDSASASSSGSRVGGGITGTQAAGGAAAGLVAVGVFAARFADDAVRVAAVPAAGLVDDAARVAGASGAMGMSDDLARVAGSGGGLADDATRLEALGLADDMGNARSGQSFSEGTGTQAAKHLIDAGQNLSHFMDIPSGSQTTPLELEGVEQPSASSMLESYLTEKEDILRRRKFWMNEMKNAKSAGERQVIRAKLNELKSREVLNEMRNSPVTK